MDQSLTKHIRESFFNPILYILPVLIFIVVDNFSNLTYAWITSLVAAGGLILYIHKNYNHSFKWYLFCMCISLATMFLMSLTRLLPINTLLVDLSYEFVFFICLSLLYVFKKPVTNISKKLVSPLQPMENNIMELYRIIKIFIILVTGYIILFLIFSTINNENTERFFFILDLTYSILVIILIIYEFINISFIRKQLTKEKWVPILNSKGKSIGSIQQISSFIDEKKYIHPVIRGLYINDNKILLQMPVPSKLVSSPQWDSFLTNHVTISETAKDCLEKTAYECFNIIQLRTFYLTKYIFETPFEYQYAFVFIICKIEEEIKAHSKYIQQVKWWTLRQIEHNLNKGIFTEQFLKEFDLLKRSGLIETDEYNCYCEID